MVGLDVLENAKGPARHVKKSEARNATYEVTPKNDENTCGYLQRYSLEKINKLKAVSPAKDTCLFSSLLICL